MIELNIIHVLLFFTLVMLQTIVGVGILVLGTPILLILDYNIVESISILLPISILTSLLNLIYFKYINKISLLSLGNGIKKSFFTICIPAIFLGIILLKYYQEVINFKILVSFLILTTLIIKKYFNNYFLMLSDLKKKIMLFGIGLVHGVSNSGGTLLSIFILNINKNLKTKTRYSLTFFYFFLAFLQYSIFIFFFQKIILLNLLTNLMLIILSAVLIGNLLVKYINDKKFNFLIEVLTLITVIFLIINNYNN